MVSDGFVKEVIHRQTFDHETAFSGAPQHAESDTAVSIVSGRAAAASTSSLPLRLVHSVVVFFSFSFYLSYIFLAVDT